MFELHPNHERAYQALARNLSAHGRHAESAMALEEALKYHPDNEIFKFYLAHELMNIGLFEEAAAQNVDYVSFWVNLHFGRYEKARELAERLTTNTDLPSWARFGPKRVLAWEMRTEQGLAPLRSAVAENLNFYEEEGIPWTNECRMYLLFYMKKAGIEDGVDEMMGKCRNTTEEMLKAQYLCPCSWFDLVTFATIDGRTDEAVERTREWLNNGDSDSLLYMDPILQEWSDRPEYQEFLDRNDEQVKRQQALYFAGVKARDRTAGLKNNTGGP